MNPDRQWFSIKSCEFVHDYDIRFRMPCWSPHKVGRNVIHGSDTVENGQKEIALWFPEGVVEWTPVAKPWIYE
jgi:hypothetical protein